MSGHLPKLRPDPLNRVALMVGPVAWRPELLFTHSSPCSPPAGLGFKVFDGFGDEAQGQAIVEAAISA